MEIVEGQSIGRHSNAEGAKILIVLRVHNQRRQGPIAFIVAAEGGIRIIKMA